MPTNFHPIKVELQITGLSIEFCQSGGYLNFSSIVTTEKRKVYESRKWKFILFMSAIFGASNVIYDVNKNLPSLFTLRYVNGCGGGAGCGCGRCQCF
jgi:hypothetical protein